MNLSVSILIGIVVYLNHFSIHAIETSSRQNDTNTKRLIDKIIEEEFITKGQISGLGLSIVNDGRLFHSAGYGYQDIENNITCTKSTLFCTGSIGKSITSTIIVKKLSEKFPDLGERVLDIPVRQLIPSYELILSDQYISYHVSFRDLLAHRVGASPSNALLFVGFTNNTEELLFRLRYATEEKPFRSGFVYNNLHYALASDIIAKIANKPFTQLVEEFFEQVGMTSSTYIKYSDDHYTMTNRSVGYYWKDGKLNRFNSETFKNVIPVLAAGGFISSAEDMAKYALLHLNKGKINENQLISESVMGWMYSNANARTPKAWRKKDGEKVSLSEYGYGLGLSLGSYDGWSVLQHGGWLPPFMSMLTFVPALKTGIFTAASSLGDVKNYHARHEDLHLRILDILQGSTPLDTTNATQQIGQLRNEDFDLKDSCTNDFHVKADQDEIGRNSLVVGENTNGSLDGLYGHYGNASEGELDILRIPGQKHPYLRFGLWGTGTLMETNSTNVFAIEWDSDFVHNYYVRGTYDFTDAYLVYDGLDTVTYHMFGKISIVLTRNMYLKNLPVIPWAPSGCSV